MREWMKCASPAAIFLNSQSILCTSSFGIFRLTDPPALGTVLQCTAKEVFHPHPDVPMYTVRLHSGIIYPLPFFPSKAGH
jgi:hypothetical protein